ncbi:hypothetical protein RchiOBHm_Chr5g0051591 [Rosa chinensis]|uniref:Uncharacterized protein n=1 Tax=Rosa chinensis TaxID=74649 RepID=A0A2P6QFE7_ROSCH|nr:hypothetical protein RchiOBHm_Chr5g0051591 [Rosa chinensis]
MEFINQITLKTRSAYPESRSAYIMSFTISDSPISINLHQDLVEKRKSVVLTQKQSDSPSEQITNELLSTYYHGRCINRGLNN